MRFLLGAVLSGFLLFQTQATPNKAASLIRSALQRKFPGAQVQVSVEGRHGLDVVHGNFRSVSVSISHFVAGDAGASLRAVAGASSKGQLGTIVLHLRDFKFNNLPIDEADVEAHDVVYDLRALKKRSQVALVSAGTASSRFVLSAAALQTLLVTKLPDVHDLKLSLSGGLLHVSGLRPAPLLGTPVAFDFAARPVAHGAELWLEDTALSLGGAAIPSAISDTLLRHLNPVYVFDRSHSFPFRATHTDIALHEGTIEVINAAAFVPAAPTLR